MQCNGSQQLYKRMFALQERLSFGMSELSKLEMLLQALPFDRASDLHAGVLSRLIDVASIMKQQAAENPVSKPRYWQRLDSWMLLWLLLTQAKLVQLCKVAVTV